jgi:hypothetical protein
VTTAAGLYKAHQKVGLLKMQQALLDDPANKEQVGLFLHTAPARKKMAAIQAAIAMHMEGDRRA